MRIALTNVYVDDQEAARRFYTEVLDFEVRQDVPLGEHRWLTVGSPEQPDGPEPLLEPSEHPAVGPYREALVADGIPLASFAVEDCHAAFARLQERGVRFTQEPVETGPATMAVFDDTCGNLVQIVSLAAMPSG